MKEYMAPFTGGRRHKDKPFWGRLEKEIRAVNPIPVYVIKDIWAVLLVLVMYLPRSLTLSALMLALTLMQFIIKIAR